LGHIKRNTMANILVTGGTGLIGRHLCKRLKEKGVENTSVWQNEKACNSRYLE